MSTTLYNYFNTSLNLNQVDNCTLLLLISADHFSAAVIQQNKVLAWIYNSPMIELLNPNELKVLLHANYAQIIAGAVSGKFTLWPADVFEQGHTAAIARLLNTEATESVLVDQLDGINKVVYAIPQSVTSSIQQYNLTRQTVFGAKGWIKAISSHSPSEQNIYINVNKGFVDILYLKENALRFFNQFDFKGTDELTYYVLAAAQELQLDLTVTHVKASGDIDAGDPCMSRLAEFFKSAELNKLQVVDVPASIPSHQFLALAALSLCASLVEA